MKKIIVEPDLLDLCASRMNQYNDLYVQDCNALFQSVDTMASAWQGRDNVAFTSKIEAYQKDLRQLSVLCTQYAEFLKNTARSYRDTQDQLVNCANELMY